MNTITRSDGKPSHAIAVRFGNRIEEWRRKCNLSCRGMATLLLEKTGERPAAQTIRRWELAERFPQLKWQDALFTVSNGEIRIEYGDGDNLTEEKQTL